MFAQRGPNETVFHTGGTLIRHAVVESDHLTLRSGDQDVLVRNVSMLGQNTIGAQSMGSNQVGPPSLTD